MSEQSSTEQVITAGEGRKLARVAEAIARWCVYLSVVLIPLFYLPFTVEALEINKQALLIVLAVVATLAWLGKMLADRRVEFRRSVMNLLIGVYVAVYAVTAWASKSWYASFVGDFGQEKAGLATLVSFVLLYFVAINTLKGVKEVRNVVMFMLLGGFLAIVQAYLQALGLRMLPGNSAQSGAFNLVGTSNALGVYAGALLAILMGSFLIPETGKMKFVRQTLAGILGVLSLLYIAALSFWALWLVVIISAAVMVTYGMIKTDKVKNVTMLAVPMAAIVIGILFSFVRFPISFGLPAEVMPSMKASWNIARSALANSPLLGSGPATFLYDYAKFHSKDLNATAFWNVQFDRSTSRLLTVLATTGILGLAAFLALAIYLAIRTAVRLARNSREDWLLTLMVFGGWVALLVGKIFYSSNLTLEFMFWMLTALLVSLEWNSWTEARFDKSPRAALLSSFFFIVAIIFSIAGLYLEGQRYVAEGYYASSVNRSLTKVEDVDASINDIIAASQLNGQNDLYFRTLSQALTLKTNLEVQKAGAKPTDDQIRQIAILAANAVNAGKQAADLNPSNVQDWSSLATLYQDLAPSTPGASEAAESAFQKAIELNPSDPTNYTELGNVYLTRSESIRQQVAAQKDIKDADKQAAQKQIDDFLSKANEQFSKAIDLKSDYAPAHYWMAMALQRQGKTAEAVKKLEAVRDYNPSDVGVGFQLGILYYQNNQKDKAVAELERVIGLNPQYSNARWYLSAMYEELADEAKKNNKPDEFNAQIDKAIAQVQEVLKYNKDDQNVQKRLADLQAKKAGTAAPAQPGLPAPVGEQKPGEVIKH